MPLRPGPVGGQLGRWRGDLSDVAVPPRRKGCVGGILEVQRAGGETNSKIGEEACRWASTPGRRPRRWESPARPSSRSVALLQRTRLGHRVVEVLGGSAHLVGGAGVLARGPHAATSLRLLNGAITSQLASRHPLRRHVLRRPAPRPPLRPGRPGAAPRRSRRQDRGRTRRRPAWRRRRRRFRVGGDGDAAALSVEASRTGRKAAWGVLLTGRQGMELDPTVGTQPY